MPPAKMKDKTISLEELSGPKLAHFYFPLNEPLLIGDKSAFTQFSDDKLPSEVFKKEKETYLFSTSEFPTAPSEAHPKNFVTLIFHHVEYSRLTDWHFKTHIVSTLLDAEDDNVLETKPFNEFFAEYTQPHFITIVEAITIVEDASVLVDPLPVIPDALKNCFDTLISYIKSARLVSHYPEYASYENMHSVVYYKITNFANDLLFLNFKHIPNANEPTVNNFIDIQQQRTIVDSVIRYQANDPVVDYLEYKNDGNLSLKLKGNYSDACVKYAIAAEILLTFLLSLAVWEETLSGKLGEKEAVKILAEQSLSTRTKKQYSARFGGQWEKIRLRWEEDIAQPRHLVVHLGRSMSIDTANKSRDTLYELEKFLADRLNEKIDKYPRTAWTFISNEGFRRRNSLKRAERILETLEPKDIGKDQNKVPQWLKDYYLWRDTIDPLIKLENSTRKASPETPLVQFSIRTAKSIENVLYLTTTKYQKIKSTILLLLRP